jgi:hypothetical protein
MQKRVAFAFRRQKSPVFYTNELIAPKVSSDSIAIRCTNDVVSLENQLKGEVKEKPQRDT